MGEYYKNNLDTYKLGTMDDFRYIRRDELENLPANGFETSTAKRDYLSDERTLYRFPWPDEDDQRFGTLDMGDRDMFRTVTIHLDEGNADHEDVCCSISDCGRYNVNVFVPCPANPKALNLAGLKHSPLCGYPTHIVGERVRDGKRRTIYECAYCKSPFSLDEAETEKVREQLRKWGNCYPDWKTDPWYLQVADRLTANTQG